jgi:hypothetical protein
MSTPLDVPKFKKQNLLLWSIPAILILVLVILYVFGWSQSNFKCPNFSRPLQYPLNSDEQVKACMSFKDLSNFKVEATKNQIDNMIAEKKDEGTTIGKDETLKFIFGRTKIEEFAKRNNITISDEELNEAIREAVKKARGEAILYKGKNPDIENSKIKGQLLQKKVEAATVNYRIVDYVSLRWDMLAGWQSHSKESSQEATTYLMTVKNYLKNEDLSPKEASVLANVDGKKFVTYLGSAKKISKGNVADDVYLKALKLPKGVSDPICNDRLCAVFRVLKVHNGAYASMKEFMEGLNGWI